MKSGRRLALAWILCGSTVVACSSEKEAPDRTRSAAQAVASPCTQDIQGIGDPAAGWTGLRTDGTVWRGTPATRMTTLGDDVVAIANIEGEALHSCAVKADGALWCWGKNLNGQVGNGTPSVEVGEPVHVDGLDDDVVQVGVGEKSTCALKTDGSVWCWGANGCGQLGTGSQDDLLAPTELTTLGTGVSQISVGYNHACALKNGTVYCWGDNLYGEVGNGEFTSCPDGQLTPTAVMNDAIFVSAGGWFNCAIKTDHTLWCWGDNGDGHLGLATGDTNNRNVPTQVTTLGANVADVDTAVRAACALTLPGGIYCWGYQGNGRLGDGVSADSHRDVPTPVNGPFGTSGATSLRLTEAAGCVLADDGTLWCWGAGGFIDGQGASTAPIEVDFCSLPSLFTIDPTTGPVRGGTPVTLTGDAFEVGVEVFFEGVPATNVTYVDPTTITAVSPAYFTTGLVEVQIVNPGNKRAFLPDAFTYTVPPALYGVTPQSGAASGGTRISVSGANLANGATLTLGGQPASSTSWQDESTLTAVTPPHPPGPVDVVITNPDGQSATLPQGFVYNAAPTITSVSPTAGPTAGDTSVQIIGSGFDYASAVHFGGQPAAEVVYVDPETLGVKTPAHAAGPVDVSVTNADGQVAILADAYTYDDSANPGSGGGDSTGNGDSTGSEGEGATGAGGGDAATPSPVDPGCSCRLGAPVSPTEDRNAIALAIAALALSRARRQRPD